MSAIDWGVIILYFVVLASVIALTRRAKNMEDFAVGSRQIPGGIIFATLSATFIGPGYVMGLANRAAGQGYIWFCIFLAFSLQTVIVGTFVAPRLRQFNKAYTLGNVMGYRYGKLVQMISGVFSVLLCAGFVGAISKASGDIISGLTGLSFVWALLISITVVLVYSTIGGIKSVIITDAMQFVLLSICVPLVLIFMITHHGAANMVSAVPEAAKTFSGHFPPLGLLGLFLGFFLGETLIPPYANRALMAEDSNSAKRGFLLSGMFSVPWFFVCASIGVLALGVLPVGTENYFVSAMQTYLPIGVLGLVMAAMISIIMSSQDSCLNAASVSFSSDVLGLFSPRFREDGTALWTSRVLNVVIGVLAVIFALSVPSVIDALLICYTLWAPTIVLPLVIAVLKKDAHPYAGFTAIVAGGLATVLWEWGMQSPGEVPSILVGVVVNQLVFWFVQAISSRPTTNDLFRPVSYQRGKPIERKLGT